MKHLLIALFLFSEASFAVVRVRCSGNISRAFSDKVGAVVESLKGPNGEPFIWFDLKPDTHRFKSQGLLRFDDKYAVSFELYYSRPTSAFVHYNFVEHKEGKIVRLLGEQTEGAAHALGGEVRNLELVNLLLADDGKLSNDVDVEKYRQFIKDGKIADGTPFLVSPFCTPINN